MSQTVGQDRGFTLIELLVVVALGAVLVSLTAPSIRRLIDVQRVSSTNAQLVTDLQFARSESATRNQLVRVTFKSDAAGSCYTIYTYNTALAGHLTACDCLQTPACAAAGSVEIRTARIPSDNGVLVQPSGWATEFAFEPVAGGLYKIPTDFPTPPLLQFDVLTYIDLERSLQTTVGLSGRPTVCALAGSKMRAPICP